MSGTPDETPLTSRGAKNATILNWKEMRVGIPLRSARTVAVKLIAVLFGVVVGLASHQRTRVTGMTSREGMSQRFGQPPRATVTGALVSCEEEPDAAPPIPESTAIFYAIILYNFDLISRITGTAVIAQFRPVWSKFGPGPKPDLMYPNWRNIP